MSTIQIIAGTPWTVADPAGEYISGTSGVDHIMGGNGHDILEGLESNDDLIGGGGNDWMSGGSGDDWMSGTAGNDIMYGNTGNDWISGGVGDPGSDLLYGGSGNDQLFGREGNDTLSGADSATWGTNDFDILEGGSGSDTFVLGTRSYTYYALYDNDGYATITDFSAADDYIQAYGLSNFYTLSAGNWGGTSALDTGIFFENNLVAVVQDTTDVDFSRDFKFV